MGTRNCNDPYGGYNPLVDRLIGPTAYDIVKFVALRMPFIQKAAANPYSQLPLVGKMVGTTTSMVFPPLVQPNTMVDSVVWLTDALGNRVKAETVGTVTYSPVGMTIVLNQGANVAWRTADILWYLTAIETRGVIHAPAP